MARAKTSILAVKKKRLELPITRKPRFESLGDGVCLGYRRNHGAGTWVARKADGKGGSKQRVIGYADDFQDADHAGVLSWAQAQARAFVVASDLHNGRSGTAHRAPLTVGDAIEQYESDLKIRGGDLGNARRLRRRVPSGLQSRPVMELGKGELRDWRDGLLDEIRPATVNRTSNALRAALNSAADQREEISNRAVWQRDLAALPDASVARNVILQDDVIRRIVAAAHLIGEEIGLLVETAAVTGARYSQLAALRLRDLRDEDASTRLMMPSSKKGKGVRRVIHRPVPIPAGLSARLRRAGQDRNSDEVLLAKYGRQPWKKSDHTRPFGRAVKRAGLGELAISPYALQDITIYALRHSSIARQILRGVPIRVVAVMHDTSVAMIEKNYSTLLADHSDAITRSALIDLSAEASSIAA
jgi:integrase